MLWFLCVCLFDGRLIGLAELGLNSGLHTCQAGTLSLEPHVLLILFLLMWLLMLLVVVDVDVELLLTC
jgi:hypothetical protein